jgi:hypothetical protein
MIKVYKMNGKTESHEVFKLGKTVIKVTFTKGNLDPKNRVPAKYASESPVVQYAIEHDPRFGKTIFLDKVYGEVAPAAPAAPVAPAKGKGKGKAADKGETLKEMPEVTTLADAVTVLTAEGAPAADFDGTVEGALKIAKGLGLSFPNLKGE